jgi:LDH2 family malate/lactate/ureidoglycolate dehydrogenase
MEMELNRNSRDLEALGFNIYEKEVPIPSNEYVRVDASSLKDFVKRVFIALGVSSGDAEIVADVLVAADLMGISSHGVQRLERYVGGVKNGVINLKPSMRFDVDFGAIAILDADNGFGQIAALKAMGYAIEKANRFGIGMVLVKHSHHFGIAGYYVLKAVERNMIGICMTNSEPLIAYINSVERYLGTNPIAFAAPRKTPPPILFDAAMSIVPIGKIEIYGKIGRDIPMGWVIGIDGSLLHGDAKKILGGIRRREAAILPIGGYLEDYGGHKGSGLALMVDILSGILSGAAWGHHVLHTLSDKPANVGHTLIAIDISKFIDLEEFLNRVEVMVKEIKSLRKAPWADNIWIPGEKAWLTMQTRLKIGIPMHQNILDSFKSIAQQLDIEFDIERIKR